MAQQPLEIGEADAGNAPNIFDLFNRIESNTSELYEFHLNNNIVEITQESDFPKQDAGTITIESGMGYWIKKPFTTAKRFICEGGEISSVVTDIPFITYTGSGVMFTATLNRMKMVNTVVSCPNATVFEVTGDGTAALAFRIVVSACVFVDCAGIMRSVLGGVFGVDNSSFSCTTTGSAILLTSPVLGLMTLERVVIVLPTGGVAVDLGSSVSNEIEINNLIVAGDPSATAISGLANSGNFPIGGGMVVSNSNFQSLTTPLVGVKENDVRVNFSQNSANVKNSKNRVDLFLEGGTETITTGLAGEWQEIGVPTSGGVSWSSDISDRFTIGDDGVITYIGEKEISVIMSGRATVEKVGGGANKIGVRIAKNWTGAANDGGLVKSQGQTQNPTPTTVPIGAITDLVFNDNIRAIFSNMDGASDIEALVSSLEIIE